MVPVVLCMVGFGLWASGSGKVRDAHSYKCLGSEVLFDKGISLRQNDV